ncbi:hypothetical protein QYF36_022688 [Acer negundo]|nr:hypothetical protein QYF36_022688 [Acer negundo]
MGSNLFLNSVSSLSLSPHKFLNVFENCEKSSFRKKSSSSSTSVVYCQGGGNKKRSIVVEKDQKAASLMDAGHLVLSPQNVKSQTDQIKDLVPFGGGAITTSLVDDVQHGIGIVNFLRGKTFFITGATGFLAKVLIEKILRTAPDVGKIYLLIKAKNKEAAMERLKTEIINAELFKCLRQTYGKSYQAFMLSKLVPVVGNVCESNLGLEGEFADMVVKDVDVIVNSAANTTFDERTAYVNGQRQGRIWEKPFSMGDSIASENFVSETSSTLIPTLDVEKEIELALKSKEASADIQEATQKLKELGLERAKKYGWQDTYVFTKAMGEMVIDSMRGDVPVVIIRPSVIESTCKEPFPGWMEGNRMMDPVVLYYGKGQLTGFLADPNGILDVVPADMVVNATLAAIARHGTLQKPDINVYQIASSVVNPLIFQDLARLIYEHYNSSPHLDSKGRPINVPSMKLFSSMEDFSEQLWRDAIQRSGLSPMASNSNGKLSQKLEVICRKSVEQAKYLAKIYEPYTFYSGRFDNSNTERLMEMMCEEEKKEFGFDVGSIDWKDYITNVHIPGLKRHVMKGRGMAT